MLGDTAIEAPWMAVHPVSQKDSIAATGLRSSVTAVKGKLAGTAARGPFDDVMERVAAPTDVTFEADTVGAISGFWAKPARAQKGAAIIHVHGGWLTFGSAVERKIG
jgi:monoterpene epsilon-lactone hydrolase